MKGDNSTVSMCSIACSLTCLLIIEGVYIVGARGLYCRSWGRLRPNQSWEQLT